MKNLQKQHYILIGGWLLINLLQAIFTGLHSDESYYWMYSQNLAWGYFDHPPMVALAIYIGHAILPGEIGVRLIMVLLSTATLALILNELNERKELFFLSVFVLSFPLIHTHIAGFLAIPDIPLLFFTMLFLLFYKRFLEKPDWQIAALLAFSVAAMIYSKYHAFLIVGFTVFSNLKLLRSKYFYGVVILSVLLLLPHFLWQINNEFPTFKYHLIERSKPFQFKYVLPYIFGVLAMAGPLTGVLVFWKLWKTKIKNQFERTLLFNILGFILLFFVMSFKNRIEAHWVAAIIPMIMLLTYRPILTDERVKKWFKRLALPVIALLFLFRIYLALDSIPNVGNAKITFYNREASALEIEKIADGKKVAFFNNYAAVSNYIFYTGNPAVHLSSPGYRFNQYDLWDDEKYGEGEELLAIQSSYMNPPHLKRTVTGQKKGYIIIEKFQPLNGLQIGWDKTVATEDNYKFLFTLTNSTNRSISTNHVSQPAFAVKQNNKELAAVLLKNPSEPTVIAPGKTAAVELLVSKNSISEKDPLLFYCRSKEGVRGEIVSFFLRDIPE